MLRKSAWLVFFGVILIASYWYSVRPPGFALGLMEDWCQPELTRQLIAESFAKTGRLSFFTDSLVTPAGSPVPFLPWGIELSWLGSWFWKWDRTFPYLWAYFGFSLLISFLGVGYILRKMRLSPLAAWGLALAVVLFHVPRHYKMWFHYEHVLEHWVYLSLFLDAWIWQRFWRDRRWSWSLEFWRGLCLLGMMGTAGYFWGPLILEWFLVRGCMVAMSRSRAKQGISTQIEGNVRQIVFPVLAGLFFVAIDLRWFLALLEQVRRLADVPRTIGWHAPPQYIARPLWLDDVVGFLRGVFGFSWKLKPVTQVETVVTVGWFFWIPFWIAISHIRRKRGGPGMQAVLPFFILLVLSIIYICLQPTWVQDLMQITVPFMKYFRVASRFALLFPALLGCMVALCWPELTGWFKDWTARNPRKAWAWVAIFLALSVWEASRLRVPTISGPPLSASAKSLLEGVKAAPGTTVLDLPFCMIGGNGVCAEQCHHYPYSTAGACFRAVHDKKVYGMYAGRLVPDQCAIYGRAPYQSWFDAWRSDRCFTEGEWKSICGYLSEHPEISTVLLYPDIWKAAGRSECLAQFDAHLGSPLAEAQFEQTEASFVVSLTRDATTRKQRILRYKGACQ